MNCHHNQLPDFRARLKADGFKVYSIDPENHVHQTYNREEFYKISLLSGSGAVYYHDRFVEINGPVLVMGSANTTFSWELIPEDFATHTCIFTEEFMKAGCPDWFEECEVFLPGYINIFALTIQQTTFLLSVFQRMVQEQNTRYTFREDLIRSSIWVLMHEACKMQPLTGLIGKSSQSTSITTLIIELAERQFPKAAQLIHSN